MKRSPWERKQPNHAEIAAANAERARSLLSRLRKVTETAPVQVQKEEQRVPEPAPASAAIAHDDLDYSVLQQEPNAELKLLVDLFDKVAADDCPLHLSVAWPHIPPRMILPWMLREVCRGRVRQASRTLFMNMGRPALQTLSGVVARTSRLQARGVFRSGIDGRGDGAAHPIGPDAHFLMFLGDTRNSNVTAVPLISIVPHAVALNDDTFWRDFDEKTLKGFKRYFDLSRLQSIRSHLDVLTSAHRSSGFAFLMPSHFDQAARRKALRCLPGNIDLVVIDMTTHAVRGRDASDLLRDLLHELELQRNLTPRRTLIVTDCPLRYSFLRSAAENRRDAGPLGTRVQVHRLTWSSRGKGWEVPAPIQPAPPPQVVTVASQECVVATRIWRHSHELEPANPLRSTLIDAAVALKGMALTASTADELLAPYADTHDAYHRIKRERHSFEPHFNKAQGLIAEGRGGHARGDIERDLADGLSLASALRTGTPLLRYLKRLLDESSRNEDILVVLRHPEDAQQANILLLDYLTEPGRFTQGVPELRVTTSSRYASELVARHPTCVVWAASPIAGTRAYVGDPLASKQFRLLVAGQDVVTIGRILKVVNGMPEYHAFQDRIVRLSAGLPRAPKEVGDISIALKLDPDRPRIALPFTGQGYMLLDGYGRVAAGPGTTFYVLDPVSQELHPHEARSIELGDAVFVMSDSIREEIEAILREKDDRGRTLEQAMVDQYKAYVKSGIERLSTQEGKRPTAARIHEMLFEANPALPSIGKQAVDYWLQAAERLDVDTPYAASDPAHFEAFLHLMGAGLMARPLSSAIRIVRSALQRDGHTNRALFDRLLLDPDSLMHTHRVTFDKLRGLRSEALENVYPVLEKHLESSTRHSSNSVQAAVS
ncbi:hypothetical protein [Bradyrhizobium sp. 141]|uniref:hypothetical protein n=1 Tax=Bradyrhizobium sp. 141 TaxID=2782617 RepID=UPI001FF86863|nr:hypothetical protein [Bradyrhizobium sp. 141]MCK1723239.1 hypothetical protein [Bradyrhizobium sp. 141]